MAIFPIYFSSPSKITEDKNLFLPKSFFCSTNLFSTRTSTYLFSSDLFNSIWLLNNFFCIIINLSFAISLLTISRLAATVPGLGLKINEKEFINLIFSKNDDLNLHCDNEQISRVIFNLIKNSIESIQEKHFKNPDFAKKINIVITNKNDYIEFIITDNGIGFSEKNLKNILKPYFTTKSKGSGLGLSIVNKIINDHNGEIKFIKQELGAKIIVKFLNK